MTRLFSTRFYYNFVYFTLSIAVLGIALGASTAHRSAHGRSVTVFQSPLRTAAAFAISVPASVALLIFTSAARSLPVTIVTAALPFVFSGAAVSRIFASRASASALFYFFDLSGAALGAGLAPALTARAGLAGTALLIGLTSGVAAVATSLFAGVTRGVRPRRAWMSAGLVALGITVVAAGAAVLVPHLLVTELRTVPYGNKPLGELLKQKDLQAQVLGVNWDEFSRTDLVSTKDSRYDSVFIDGGAASQVYRWQGPQDETVMREDIAFYPLELAAPGKVAVIGAGAGREVQMSLLAGSPAVTAIELNRGSIELVRQLGAYAGNVYDRPGVTVVSGDARRFLERTTERFDTIYLSLVMTDTAGRFGASLIESYALTVEAFRTYMARLAPGGRLVVQVHSGDELTKVVLTLVEAMRTDGVGTADALDRLIAVGPDPGQEHGTVHHPLVVFRPGRAFLGDEAARAADLATRDGFRIYYVPLKWEEPLRDLKSGKTTPAGLARSSNSYVTPATDVRPFFYRSEKGVPDYIAGVLAAGLAGTYLALGGLGRFSRAASVRAGGPASATSAPWNPAGLYFAGLGFGFMAVEMVLIQRLTAFLGQPVLAASAVLGALLGGAGIGSIVGGRHWWPARRVAIGPILCSLAALLVWPGLTLARTWAFTWPLTGRLVLAGALAAGVGFVLGIPFPAGLSHFGSERPGEIPRFWAVNGAAAVAGSAGSLTLAMLGGFNLALASGIAAYGVSAIAGTVARATTSATSSRVPTLVSDSMDIAESVSGGEEYARSRQREAGSSEN